MTCHVEPDKMAYKVAIDRLDELTGRNLKGIGAKKLTWAPAERRRT
jgi:hypothetical protein